MEITPESELTSRIGWFQGLLREGDIDCALICQNFDLFIPQEGKPILMVKKSWTRPKKESAVPHIIFLEKIRHIPRVLREWGFDHIGTIGLEMDEYPFLDTGMNTSLEEGMVFAFEPKLVFPGNGVIGIEDMYIVSSRGVEKLTFAEERIIVLPE